jgi:hypothetical protein
VRQQAHPDHRQRGGAAPFPHPAELRIADAQGDSAAGCVPHVEAAILNVTSVFIASEDLGDLDAYVNRR